MIRFLHVRNGIDIQRGPPRPRTNSLPRILIKRSPYSSNFLLVTVLRSYTTTTPGAIVRVFDPSFHCSRAAATMLPSPHGIKVTFFYTKVFSKQFSQITLFLQRSSIVRFHKLQRRREGYLGFLGGL